MKKTNKMSNIKKIIILNASGIISFFFLFLSCVSYMFSLPDGTTKLKNVFWGCGLILSLILYIFRNDIPKFYKYFPFAFYIFMCICSLPFGRTIVNTNVLFIKPIATPCIILLLIYLLRQKRTQLLLYLRFILVMIFFLLFAFDILSMGKIIYLLGNSSEASIGYINKIYLEMFFVCFGSSLNIPLGNGVYLNLKQFSKLIISIIISGVSVIATTTIIIRITNTPILFREFFTLIILLWYISTFYSYIVMLLFAKKRCPGDRIYRKLFYDRNDILLTKKHFLEYKKVVDQINTLKEELKYTSGEKRIPLEQEISELQEYEQFLR